MSPSGQSSLMLGFVGDLLVDRESPPEPFESVRGAFEQTDVLFGNLEGPYTDDPHPAPSSPITLCPSPSNLVAYWELGFDVLTLANNHIVDAGHAAMLDTRDRLRAKGVATCGVGHDLDSAREPAVIESEGVSIAYLGYSSIFPSGYEARTGIPGLAPMRAHTLYVDQVPNYHAPGTDPVIKTVPYDEDLANLYEDIEKASEQADLVICSFHWGDFMKAFHLTDHETRTARQCIDAGADMVVGHHHHVLRGMEWYKGKPIMYGLGHFVFDLRVELPPHLLEHMHGKGEDPSFYGVAPRDGWPLLPLHAESRMTLFAWARADTSGVHEIGFLPCRLRPDGKVDLVSADSEEGREVCDYLEKCCTTQGLNAKVELHESPFLNGIKGGRILDAERTIEA